MSMKNTLSIVAAVTAAMFTQVTIAQPAPPAARADVKAETRAAEKAGKLAPAGESPTPMADPASGARSTKTRAQRKSETMAAEKAGTIAKAGEAPTPAMDPASATGSTKSRAQRKAETRQAIKTDAIPPAGEGPQAPKK